MTITLECPTTNAWAGEQFTVTATVGAVPYGEDAPPITWSHAGSATATGTKEGNAYTVNIGTNTYGTVTVSATAGTTTATLTVYVHRVSGITVTPADVVAYDTPVTFTATFEGGKNPASGVTWSGPVTGFGPAPSYETAASDWTSGGFKDVSASGGTSTATNRIKAIQLVIEAFAKHEPAKLGETTGFDVVVNGALGETPTFTWSGAVSGSSAEASYPTTFTGTDCASVVVELAGQTVTSTAELKIIDIDFQHFVEADYYGSTDTVLGDDDGMFQFQYFTIVDGIQIDTGTFSGTVTSSYPNESLAPETEWGEAPAFEALTASAKDAADPVLKGAQKQRMIIGDRERNEKLSGSFSGYGGFPETIEYRKMNVETIQWADMRNLYSGEAVGPSVEYGSDNGPVQLSWTDGSTGMPCVSSISSLGLTVQISLSGRKVKRTDAGGTTVGYLHLEAVVSQNFATGYEVSFPFGGSTGTSFTARLKCKNQVAKFKATGLYPLNAEADQVVAWQPGNTDVDKTFSKGTTKGTTSQATSIGRIAIEVRDVLGSDPPLATTDKLFLANATAAL